MERFNKFPEGIRVERHVTGYTISFWFKTSWYDVREVALTGFGHPAINGYIDLFGADSVPKDRFISVDGLCNWLQVNLVSCYDKSYVVKM